MHASQQTYIQRLGFQDPDRNNTRHGLACEYLLHQLIQQAYDKALEEQPQNPSDYWWESLRRAVVECAPKPSKCLNVPIVNGKFINGFADVIAPYRLVWSGPSRCYNEITKTWYMSNGEHGWVGSYMQALGEVKIAQEPAERVLQQINFYRQYVNVDRVVILLDYDDQQLHRMVKGSDIEVCRLGRKFEEWCEQQKHAPAASTPEL